MDTDSVLQGASKEPEEVSESLSEIRSGKMTEKGVVYQLELKQKDFHSAFKSLLNKSNELNQLMVSGAAERDVTHLYKDWMTDYEHFLKIFDDVCSLMSADEKRDFVSTHYNDKDVYLKNVKTSVENWFTLKTGQTEKTKTEVQPKDSASQVTTSRRSRTSRRSASSLASHVSSARLAEEQRKAELEAKASILKKKQELDLAKFQIQLKQEELVIETELAISDAKQKVLDKYADSVFGGTEGQTGQVDIDFNKTQSVTVPTQFSPDFPVYSKTFTRLKEDNKTEHTHDVNVDVVHTTVSTLNPDVKPFTPNYGQVGNMFEHSMGENKNDGQGNCRPVHTRLQEVNHQQIDPSQITPNVSPEVMLLSVVKNMNKPTPEIMKFNGDPLDYRKFVRQFQSKVVNNTDSDSDKLAYLEQLTTGEPNRIVSGYSYLDATQGYYAAINELEQRYGSHDVLASAFVKRALDWPSIKADSPKALDEFGIFLAECGYAVKSITAMKVLEYPDNLKKLVGKLPYSYHDKWRAQIQRRRDNGEDIQFSQFVEFVKLEARKANDPVYGKDALRPEINNDQKGKAKTASNKAWSSYVTKVTDDRSTQTTTDFPENSTEKVSAFNGPCSFCDKTNHSLVNCERISSEPYQERIEFLKHKSYCYGCLRVGHQRKDCRNKATCKICGGRHPTICHVEGKPPPNPNYNGQRSPKPEPDSTKSVLNETTNSDVVHSTATNDGECTMAILPVSVKFKNGMKVIQTYAFMDPGSTATFCSESLVRQLGGSGKPVRITLNTMGESQSVQTLEVNGLEVCDLNMQNTIQLPKVYTKDKIPVDPVHIPKKEDVEKWPHLSDLTFPEIQGEIGLLIGNNIPDAYSPQDIRTGTQGSPHATKSMLGWILWNVVRDDPSSVTSNTVITVNRAEVAASDQAESLKLLDRKVQDCIKLDFPEHSMDDRKDKQFLQPVSGSVHIEEDEYCSTLPLRCDNLHNNEINAKQRQKGFQCNRSANEIKKGPKCTYLSLNQLHFAEISSSSTKKRLSKDSPLGKLEALIDNGIHRLGGRLIKSNIGSQMKVDTQEIVVHGENARHYQRSPWTSSVCYQDQVHRNDSPDWQTVPAA